MYTLEYFIRVIGKNQYAFDYKLYHNKNVLDAGTYKYFPRQEHDTLNSARNMGRWAVRTAMAKKYGIKKMKTVCLNPESDFLSRAELAQISRQKRALEQAKPVENVILGEPQKVEIVNTSKERLYEVVEVGGVWTIKKHNTKWFTAEDAKTQLFAKVVNGD